MAAHLDAHFRRNMRLKDKSKKVLARDWAPQEQVLLHARHVLGLDSAQGGCRD